MKYALPLLALIATPALADPPVIEAAVASPAGNAWRIDVTLSHPDTGWDHYANGWEVLAPDGTRLGLRVLVHPHVDEQPFTRSFSRGSGAKRRGPCVDPRALLDGWLG